MGEHKELPKRKTIDDVLNAGLPEISIQEESKVFEYSASNAPQGDYRRVVKERYPVNKQEFSDDLAVIEGYLNGLGILRRPLGDSEKAQAKRCFALVLKSGFLGVKDKNGPVEPKYWRITGSDEALRGFPVARRYRQEFGGLNERGFNLLARVVPLLGNEQTNILVKEELLSDATEHNNDDLKYRIPQVVKIFSTKGATINGKNRELLKSALQEYRTFKADSDNRGEVNWRENIIKQAEKITSN